MGDMADYALEQVYDAEDERFAYRMGEMSDQDAYDAGIIDEMGGYNHPPMFGHNTRAHRTIPSTSSSKTCGHCGTTGLRWVDTGHGWRLADSQNKVHSCDKWPFKETAKPRSAATGTVSARFEWLLRELEKRVGEVDKFSSVPPESTLLRRLDALLRDSGYEPPIND